jgi:hypothetical protein
MFETTFPKSKRATSKTLETLRIDFLQDEKQCINNMEMAS